MVSVLSTYMAPVITPEMDTAAYHISTGRPGARILLEPAEALAAARDVTHTMMGLLLAVQEVGILEGPVDLVRTEELHT